MQEQYYEILVVPVASLLKWDDYNKVSYICSSSECAKDVTIGIEQMLPKSSDVILIIVAGLYGVEQFYDDEFYEDLGEVLVELAGVLENSNYKGYITVYGSKDNNLKDDFMPRKLNPLMKKPGRFMELRWLVVPLVVLGSGELIDEFIRSLMDEDNEDTDALADAIKKHLGHKNVYILPPMPVDEGLEAIIEVQEAITGFLSQNVNTN
ncbi:MAG: hypothetical protein F7C81_06045 [Desulfurococcales archaeon]|nr:hypothetical protein [Desulfurococcales archaeon]